MTLQHQPTGLQLRSLIKASGELELSLEAVDVAEPVDDQVLIRVEGTPINPSDLGLLLGPADLSTAVQSGSIERPIVTAKVPESALRTMGPRLDRSMPVGNEGAGVVIAAGPSEAAQALVGRTVAVLGGAMYAQYRTARARDCLILPAGTTAADGASSFVNPLTALGMVETMRGEGHSALVHTAAASNLGQMLNKLCEAEGVALVNIVRSGGQADLLRGLGAQHIVNSTSPSFSDELVEALDATGATIAFDAIGGGRIASQILAAMEAVANRKATGYSGYGSSTHKQVYIYGGLDTSPTTLGRNFGMAWGVGGWLQSLFVAKIGQAEAQRLRERVASELTTTFASHYTKEISLAEALQVDTIISYAKRATGEKVLLNPSMGLGSFVHQAPDSITPTT